jgi:hypothetical protein
MQNEPIEICLACRVDPSTGRRSSPIMRLVSKPSRGEYAIERKAGDLRARTFRSFAPAKTAYRNAVEAAGLTVIRNAAGEVA